MNEGAKDSGPRRPARSSVAANRNTPPRSAATGFRLHSAHGPETHGYDQGPYTSPGLKRFLSLLRRWFPTDPTRGAPGLLKLGSHGVRDVVFVNVADVLDSL